MKVLIIEDTKPDVYKRQGKQSVDPMYLGSLSDRNRQF